MTVIGFFRNDFTTEDQNVVTGYRVFVGHKITVNGDGMKVDTIYLTDSRLAKSGYNLRVGDEVKLLYNRFGKIETVVKC